MKQSGTDALGCLPVAFGDRHTAEGGCAPFYYELKEHFDRPAIGNGHGAIELVVDDGIGIEP